MLEEKPPSRGFGETRNGRGARGAWRQPNTALVGSFTFAALCLAACAPVPDPKPNPIAQTCPAPTLQGLVGQPESAAAAIGYDGPARIILPGMAVTMDYSPARLNIEIGTDGRISRIFCG